MDIYKSGIVFGKFRWAKISNWINEGENEGCLEQLCNMYGYGFDTLDGVCSNISSWILVAGCSVQKSLLYSLAVLGV